MNQEYLQQYARFAVHVGVNLQKGQTLLIRSPIEGAELARLCAEAAYDAGAREVVVFYNDEQLSRIKMQRAAVEVLEDVKPWQLRSYLDYVEGEGGAAVLTIMARDPEIYKGIDTAKINRASNAASVAMKPFSELTMASRIQWSIVAMPSAAWATRVFPKATPEVAVADLWDVIFKVCRVDGGDPVTAWQAHTAAMRAHSDWLNGLALQSVHLQSKNGTDLVVGLADDHVWAGGTENSTGGVPFLPNIPTEEVFTAPHRLRTDGVVKSSMPYVYGGNLIEGITVRFEQGQAVGYSAEKGQDLLQQMMAVDEGAKHLGEIALVPASSPIRQSGILFYNTLFDENAACHMAFGAGYPGTVRGGEEMSREALRQKGVNDSLIHEDIMIGTDDMDVTGITAAGERVALMRGGEWVR